MGSNLARFERLERRQMLAGATNSVDVWTITGTDAGERITINLRASDQRLRAIVDGQVIATRKLAGLKLIEVLGNGGNDVIEIDLHDENSTLGVWVNGGTGRDRIFGGALNENLGGGSGRDVIDGGRGDDIVRGGTDRDDVAGGDGNDYVQGNAGNDTLTGGWGDDRITGGTGRDQLRGGDGSDKVIGGKDSDTIKGGAGADLLQAGGGSNLVYRQNDGDGDEVVSGTSDSLEIEVGDGPFTRLNTKADLRRYLVDRAVFQWKYQFGTDAGTPISYGWDRGEVLIAASDVALLNALTQSSAFAVADASTTNTQELGVDETDIVETDGEYIYLLHNYELLIIDADPAGDMTIISRTPFADDITPGGLYLDGDRLTVVTQSSGIFGAVGPGIFFDTSIPQGRPRSVVTVFDISDRAAPTKISETAFEGDIIDSRVIDGRLYLVHQNYLNAPAPRVIEKPDGSFVFESEAEYRQRMLGGDINAIIPRYTTNAAAAGDVIAAPDVYAREGNRLDTTTVTLINLRDALPAPIASTSVIGAEGQVYASADNLYLAGDTWNQTGTELVKFGLGIDQVSLQAGGKVDGFVLDQFSMDEEGEFFRIATTTRGFLTDVEPTNLVTVLDQVGDDLVEVGRVDGIAPGEEIFSARFLGDRAYLVTFQFTDPLFVLDMSDSAAPQVKGELVIPGFSNHLQPIAEHLILGIGEDDGGQASLFDVSDPTSPTRVDTFKLGSSASLASWEHHALSYFPEQGILALPADDGHALRVLAVTSSGFDDLGAIEHPDAQVLRSVRIGDNVFSIGTDAIRARLLDDVDHEVATLGLPEL